MPADPIVLNGSGKRRARTKSVIEDQSETVSRSQRDLDALAKAYKNVLIHIGEDAEREGLKDTPMRAAKAITYFTKGYEDSVGNAVSSGVFNENTDEMVVVKDIEMFSLCEHHLVPFMGKVTIESHFSLIC